MLQQSGKYAGVACADGMYLNQRKISGAVCVSFDASQRLLINRSVQAAVFLSSPRMILAEGLAYDRCAVGIVTDMAADAQTLAGLAEFDVNDADALYKVVRSQVDVVLPDGVAVLNAADQAVVELAQLCDGKVIYYGADPALEAIAAHRAAGERAVFLHNDRIVLATGAGETELLSMTLLHPDTAAQAQAVLAAVAAAWALGVAPELICASLRAFTSKPRTAPY